jgi:hypothetical protein
MSTTRTVIPAQAGIQSLNLRVASNLTWHCAQDGALDSRLRGNDDVEVGMTM